MRRLFLIILLSMGGSAYGYSLEGDVGIGYRQDGLHWSMGGGSQGPNILSELKWKNLSMINYFGQLRVYAPFISYVRLTGNYGSIFSGRNTDSDYNGNNRTDLFSYAICDAGRGEAFELSAAIGQTFNWIPYMTLIPLLGYSVQEQHLQFYDGIQVFYLGNTINAPFQGLASNYRGKWYTPFLGLDLNLKPTENLQIIGTAEWHWGWFRGTGHWNLRTDFLSDVRQKATGSGALARVQGIYTFWKCLTCGLACEYISMGTRPGTHGVDVNQPIIGPLGEITGNQTVFAGGKLNEVHWRSWRIMITGGFNF